ncbi:glycoside hydrolase family 2 protein [Arthrobacter sp. NPDC058097]|uniref:glycoside hydrolase family 2 protein n=1 Tax=Arthrobacter sp. NPDC058097 TaxID=3346340 RepID=UPI0036DEE3AD
MTGLAIGALAFLGGPAEGTPSAGPVSGANEPAGTEILSIGGTNVVSQYGRVVPSFDGWSHTQPTRDYQKLDGKWRFTFDPGNRGLDEQWFATKYNDKSWASTRIPAAWDLEDTPDFGSLDGANFGQGTAFTDGYAWYRSELNIPKSWNDKDIRLNFLAVNYRADVWVNGAFLGTHEGGNTPFSLPAKNAIAPGERASIAVRVYRAPSYPDYATGANPITDNKAIPYKPVDYWPYAGITRSAWIEATPEVVISKLLVKADGRTFDGRVVIENTSSGRSSGHVTVDPGKKTGMKPVTVGYSIAAGATGVVSVIGDTPGVQRWFPESPTIQEATARVETDRGERDELTTRYGARELSVHGSKITINGRQQFLKGLNWHEENATRGRAMTTADLKRELDSAKEAHANFLRNSVYNRHPYVYEWADENGMLLMDDVDNMWLNTPQERLQTEQYGLSRALAVMMAWNQHNSPSVILWGLQNESEIDPGGAAYKAWIKDMKDAVKAVDISQRPVTWASSTTADPAFDIADVIGFNEYFGYFYGASSDLGRAIDGVHAKYPDKPILITENGTWSLPGNHGPADTQGTEEWQAAYFQAHWDEVAARPEYVAGYTHWVLKDYKERAGYNQAYNGVSVMGMLAFDGTKKLVYAAFQDAALPVLSKNQAARR